MRVLERIFHLKNKNATLKGEIIGGLCTFVAMCYILPVNSSILSDMGMNPAGVFAITALMSFLVTLIMGLVANYPLVLSAGMGCNAFITYTIAIGAGYTWQQAMILLTFSGVLFLIVSLTPVRRWIVEAIPKNIKHIISASLGAFICFVGLRNSGIITAGSTLVAMGSLTNPAVIIGLLGIFLCFGLMLVKHKTISNLAVPIAVLVCAVVAVITSTIMMSVNHQSAAEYMAANPTMPVLPWLRNDLSWGIGSGVKDVLFYGTLNDSSHFGKDIVKVLTTPTSYVAIFSLCFVCIFDTTATLLAVSENTGVIDEHGKINNYRRIIVADTTGALVCPPMGTSTVTWFAESNVGISMGARTGLAACVSSLLFLACAFIYPVFSIFTAGAVTAPALVCVGAMIFVGNVKEIDFSDRIIGFTAFMSFMFAILCYSIASGIGVSLICFSIMMIFAGKRKEVPVAIYVIALLFIVSFTLTAILPYLAKPADGETIAGMKLFFGW